MILMDDSLLTDTELVILGGGLVMVIILSMYRHYCHWRVRYMGSETVTFLKVLFLMR